METITQHWENGDLEWQKVLRAMQSTWREAQGMSAGRGGGDQRLIGSRLSADHAASGRNFLTDVVRDRVEAELKHAASEEGRGRVIEEQRLSGNLLASQPLAFNLFAELREHPALARRALVMLFPDLAQKVEGIKFEWSPGRGDDELLGNHSAFDVAIELAASDGTKHCAWHRGQVRRGDEDVGRGPAASPDVAVAAGLIPSPATVPCSAPSWCRSSSTTCWHAR